MPFLRSRLPSLESEDQMERERERGNAKNQFPEELAEATARMSKNLERDIVDSFTVTFELKMN